MELDISVRPMPAAARRNGSSTARVWIDPSRIRIDFEDGETVNSSGDLLEFLENQGS